MAGGFSISEKYMSSSIGMMTFQVYEKNKTMFQTTYQNNNTLNYEQGTLREDLIFHSDASVIYVKIRNMIYNGCKHCDNTKTIYYSDRHYHSNSYQNYSTFNNRL